MGEARNPRLRVANEGNRASDVAQRPQREREVQHCWDDLVLAEAKGQIVVTPRLEQGERAFEMLSRFEILSGGPMSVAGCAVSNSGLGRIGSRPDVAKEGLSVGLRLRQLAASEAAGPKAIVGCQPFGRVLVAPDANSRALVNASVVSCAP
jgi:hypothetical protein